MFKACIFDLDGVIIDTAQFHFLSWKRIADELEVTFTIADNEKLKGVGRMQSLEAILSMGNLVIEESEKKKLTDRKNDWFIEFVNKIQPEDIFPGVIEVFNVLKKNSIAIALGSSSKNAQLVIDRLQIRSYFDVIVDGLDIQNTKPNPEVFLKAAKLLNIPAIDCIVVEDAQAGVEAALRAGMKCIGIGTKEKLRNANLVLTQTRDITIERLKNIKLTTSN